jgi:UDP-N-acetylglucosamine acyltransferase
MMLEAIHPTAIVDPKAALGRDVRIGPLSIVGPEVTLGDGAELGHHVTLEGRVEIGPRARIGHGAVLGGKPQDLKYKEGTPSGVRIGAETVVREYVTIHRASRPESWTEIGAGCLIMALSHVAHDCRLGQGVIVINYAGITGYCDVGDYVTVGGSAGLAPFTRVGAYAYIGGMSKVTTDVPPYMLVDGLPASVRSVNVIGMRRAGIPASDRRAVQNAHRVLYRSGLSPHRAVERLRELPPNPLVEALIRFVASAKRGVCGPPGGWGAGQRGDEASAESEPEDAV